MMQQFLLGLSGSSGGGGGSSGGGTIAPLMFGVDNSSNAFDTSTTTVGKATKNYNWSTWGDGVTGSRLGSDNGGVGVNSAQVIRAKVFSDYASASNGYNHSPYKAFDGTVTTFCEPADNSTVTFDFTSMSGGGITVGSSLRMYLNKAGNPLAGHFTVNGTALGGSVGSNTWLTINSVSLLETITFYHASGSSSVELKAVEVDGVILEDIPDYVEYSISTDTSARYLWSSNDGEHWSHSGFNNDTASATIKVKTRYLGWASGSNSSTTTVSGAYPDSVHWFQPYGHTANKLRHFRFYGTNAPPGNVDGKPIQLHQSPNRPNYYSNVVNNGGYDMPQDAQVYSGMLSSGGLKTPLNGFHGGLSTSGGRSEGTGGLTFTPSTPITFTDKVRVYDNNNVTKSQVNSGSFVQHAGNSWVDVATGGGTINSMYFVRTDSSSYDAGFMAIEVDGKILSDASGFNGGNLAANISNSDWSHYKGGCTRLFDGGFRLDLINEESSDFFVGFWIKWNDWSTSRQFGLDLFGGYVYFETIDNSGTIGIRHNGGSRVDSSATDLEDGNWHHVALSRSGSTLHGFVDGTSVVSTTSGVSGNSFGANEQIWMYGGNGTAYNANDAQIMDLYVSTTGTGSNFSLPDPLIATDGSINHPASLTAADAVYASPMADLENKA